MSDTAAATEATPPADSQYRHVEIGGEGAVSAREAARALAQNRYKNDALDQREEPIPEAPIEADGPVALDKQVSEEEIPATAEEAPGEQPEAIEPAEEAPSFELPRSWGKDKAELWAKLDPATQEYLLEQDSKATQAVRRSQNEAAEQHKALEVERTAVQQARQQYEQALPALLQQLHQATMGEFADIKTMQDVENLARTDWPRFAAFQAQQMKIQAVQNEMTQTQQRQQQEFGQKWQQFSKDEDAKFLEAAPELKDEAIHRRTSEASIAMLQDVGFSDSDLSKLWNGEASLSLRDHRAQLLIRDALRYREAKKAAPAKAVRPVPNVQRPGSPVHRAADGDIVMKNLNSRLNQTGDRKTAVELILAQRAAAANRR